MVRSRLDFDWLSEAESTRRRLHSSSLHVFWLSRYPRDIMLTTVLVVLFYNKDVDKFVIAIAPVEGTCNTLTGHSTATMSKKWVCLSIRAYAVPTRGISEDYQLNWHSEYIQSCCCTCQSIHHIHISLCDMNDFSDHVQHFGICKLNQPKVLSRKNCVAYRTKLKPVNAISVNRTTTRKTETPHLMFCQPIGW